MGIFDRFKKKKKDGNAQAGTNYSNMIGSTPDKARMEEIRFNDFSQDAELPVKFRSNASTADIAAYKMLKNVTPEMMQDPVLASQLNKFVGGNFASATQKRIAGAEANPESTREHVQATAFRLTPIDTANLTTLMNLHLDSAKFGNEKLSDRLVSDFGSGTEEEAQQVMLTLSAAMASDGSASGLTDLLGISAQGMNGSRSFTDSERSTQMMNQLMLRSVTPRYLKKAQELGYDSFDHEHETEGSRLKDNTQNFQRAINRPDAYEDHGYGVDSSMAIKQFSSQLGWNGIGATTADAEANIPKNDQMAQTYAKPQAAPKKKSFFDRFKRKKTA